MLRLRLGFGLAHAAAVELRHLMRSGALLPCRALYQLQLVRSEEVRTDWHTGRLNCMPDMPHSRLEGLNGGDAYCAVMRWYPACWAQAWHSNCTHAKC